MVAPTARSQRREATFVRRRAMRDNTDAEAGRLPERGHEEEEEDGNRHTIVGTRPAERRHDPRHVVNADDQPDRDTAPGEDATDEAEAPATDTREDQGDDEKSVERVHAGLPAPDRGTPTACPLDRSHRQHRSFRASGFVAVDPLVDGRRLPVGERVEQLLGFVGNEEHRSVLRADEPFGDRVIEEGDERVVEAVDVQQPERLGVQAELRPRGDLDDLFDGAEAAGQRDEAVATAPPSSPCVRASTRRRGARSCRDARPRAPSTLPG